MLLLDPPAGAAATTAAGRGGLPLPPQAARASAARRRAGQQRSWASYECSSLVVGTVGGAGAAFRRSGRLCTVVETTRRLSPVFLPTSRSVPGRCDPLDQREQQVHDQGEERDEDAPRGHLGVVAAR